MCQPALVRWRDDDADGSLDETLYWTTDANMNVTAAISTTGTVVERYAYDAYGRPTFRDADDWDDHGSSSVDATALYCGYQWDARVELYHVRYRVLEPDLGRWLQPDPLGYVDGMGLCEYVGGSPGTQADPLGLLSPGYLLYWADWHWRFPLHIFRLTPPRPPKANCYIGPDGKTDFIRFNAAFAEYNRADMQYQATRNAIDALLGYGQQQPQAPVKVNTPPVIVPGGATTPNVVTASIGGEIGDATRIAAGVGGVSAGAYLHIQYGRGVFGSWSLYGGLVLEAAGAAVLTYELTQVGPTAKKAAGPAERAAEQHDQALDQAIEDTGLSGSPRR